MIALAIDGKGIDRHISAFLIYPARRISFNIELGRGADAE